MEIVGGLWTTFIGRIEFRFFMFNLSLSVSLKLRENYSSNTHATIYCTRKCFISGIGLEIPWSFAYMVLPLVKIKTCI